MKKEKLLNVNGKIYIVEKITKKTYIAYNQKDFLDYNLKVYIIVSKNDFTGRF